MPQHILVQRREGALAKMEVQFRHVGNESSWSAFSVHKSHASCQVLCQVLCYYLQIIWRLFLLLSFCLQVPRAEPEVVELALFEQVHGCLDCPRDGDVFCTSEPTMLVPRFRIPLCNIEFHRVSFRYSSSVLGPLVFNKQWNVKIQCLYWLLLAMVASFAMWAAPRNTHDPSVAETIKGCLYQLPSHQSAAWNALTLYRSSKCALQHCPWECPIIIGKSIIIITTWRDSMHWVLPSPRIWL